MSELLFIESTVIFALVLILTGRFFYKLAVGLKAKYYQRKLKFCLDNLNFSYEQISYFVTKNSNFRFVGDINTDHFFLDFHYSSVLFPELRGIKICINNDNEKKVLAYLAVEKFRCPKLDKYLQEDKISQIAYQNISCYKLLQKDTQKKVINHAYNQFQVGRLGSKET